MLWCEAIRRSVADGVQGRPEDGIGLLPAERRDAWAALADGTWHQSALAPNGFTVTALYAALHGVEQASEERASMFRTGIAAAIALGDDTDTIAAITGSLLGAWAGAEEIPAKWADAVHGWPGYDGPRLSGTDACDHPLTPSHPAACADRARRCPPTRAPSSGRARARPS